MTQQHNMEAVYYQCGICGCLHPWEWNGDCRENANRFTLDQLEDMYGDDYWHLDIRSMEERIIADNEENPYESEALRQ